MAVCLALALSGVNCVQDFVTAPERNDYQLEATSSLSYSVNIGDTVTPPSARLLVAGSVVDVQFAVSVDSGTSVEVDSAERLVVIGAGTSRVKVRPMSTALPTDTLHVYFRLRGVVPRLVIAGADTAFSVGDTLAPTVTAQTRAGVTIPGIPVTWQLVSGDTAFEFLSAATGRARALRNGDAVLRATSDTATATRTIRVRQRAARVSLTTQPSVVVANGVVFAQQPVVQLRDALLNPVSQAGVVVTAAIATGGGALGGTLTATTNASGVATFTNLSITGTIGVRTLSFGASSLTGVASNSITVTPGAANQLTITTQPSASAASGAAFTQQPVLQLRDASLNAVSQAGVVVTAAIATGGGTLGGTVTATTNASGVATFTNLSITGAIGDRTLTFSAPALASVMSDAVTVTPGPVTQLTITTQPSAAAASSAAFAQQPVIQLRDASLNAVSQAGVVVTAAIATGAGTLGGALTATTNASGVATFTDLSITGTVGDRTLFFSAPSLTGVPSGAITVTPGPATQLTITTQPAVYATSGVALAPQPVIQLRDASLNAVSQAGVVVTAAIGTGAGTLGGTLTATSNASGVAAFADLTITGPFGDRTLSFSASSLTGVTSLTVTVGVATQLTIATQPSVSAASGVAFAQQPVIQLRDGGGSAADQAGVVVTAAIATGGGTLGGTVTATTNASGVATFTNLAITGAIGDRTLSFSAPPLTGVTSNTVTVTPGAATLLTITTQPSAAAASGAALGQQPVLQLRDASLNAVSQAGVVVTAAIATGGGALGGTLTTTTNASGVATFADLTISGTIGDRTLNFSAPSLSGVTSNTITVTPGAASQLTITTQPSATVLSGAAIAQQPVIQLQDASLNAVSQAGVVVTAAIATGAGTLGGTLTATTNASGVATFTNLSITGTVGDRTLSFSAPSTTGVTSNTITVTPGPMVSVAVSPAGTTIAGGTTPFTAIARDAGGNAIGGATFVWASLNPNVATVDAATGLVTAVASGQVTVSATSGSLTGYALVTVAATASAPVNLWTEEGSGTTETLYDVWGSRPGNVFAVGSSGGIARWTGTSWTTTDFSASFSGVWGLSDALAWAVGGPRIYRWNGSSWSEERNISGASFNAIWGSAPNDVFAVGSSGVIYHYDGSVWSQQTSNTSNHLQGIYGFSRNEVYTVDASGTVRRYDGSGWSAFTSPAGGNIADVWGTAGNDLYVAANFGIWRYNGTSWSQTLTGSVRSDVWGSSASDIYAPSGFADVDTIMRYGGSAWSGQRLQGSYGLKGVWGFGDSAVIAVGLSGKTVRGVRGATVTLTPTTPTLNAIGATQQMNAAARDAAGIVVTGVAFTWESDDPSVATVSAGGLVTAVSNGTAGVCAAAMAGPAGCATVTVAQAASSITVTPGGASISSGTTTFTATAEDANSNAITDATFAWASLNPNVATVSASTGTVTAASAGQVTISATADGVTGFAVVTVSDPGAAAVNLWAPMTSGTSNGLWGVWGTSPTNAYAVGDYGTILRLDGTSWTAMTSATSQRLYGLWGTSPTNVYAVGENGTIQRFDGISWSAMSSGTVQNLFGVWGTSPTNVYAVGDAGTILRFDGTSWSLMTSGTALRLDGVWGTSPTNVYSVGNNGTILRFDGTSWSATSEMSYPFRGVWGTSPTSVYAVGDVGKILRFDGTSWAAMTSGTEEWLTSVWGTSPTNVYAVSDLGTILRFDGTSWSATSVPSHYFRGVWGTSPTIVYAVGGSGKILRGIGGAMVTVTPATPTLTSIGATQQMTATARDASSNAISGVTFTWTSSNSGVATVSATGLVTTVAYGTASVCATAPGGLQGCTALTVAAPKLVFVTQPSSIVRTAPFNPTVQVALRDGAGNPIPGASATINLTVGSNPGSGSLVGAASVPTASGVATFSALSVNQAGGGYTLVANAGGYTAATSQSFDVAAHGPATALAFVTQPSNAGYLVSISPSVQVAVRDQYGNPVTTEPADLALGLSTNPSGATLSGGGAVAAVGGIATFPDLTLDQAGTGYVLSATVSNGPALPAVNSNSFNVSAIGTVVSSSTAINGMVRDGTMIYFTERGSTSGTVKRVPVTGGPATTLASDLLQPVAIVSDGANLYWIETGDGGTAQARIARMAITGGEVSTVAGGLTIANSGRWLFVEDGSLFWIQGTTVQSVLASATNGVATALVTEAEVVRDMTVQAGTVYYFLSGSIRRVPTTGGASSLVASSVSFGGGSHGGMLVIGSELYFGNGYLGCIASVPVTGGTPSCRSTIAGLQAYYSFATDGASLYLVARIFTIESVWRFPLSDFASPTELVSNHQWYIGDQSRLLLLDAQSAYFNTNVQNSGEAIPTGLKKRSK